MKTYYYLDVTVYDNKYTIDTGTIKAATRPDSFLYAVSIERNFTGLRNYNRMSYILQFD